MFQKFPLKASERCIPAPQMFLKQYNLARQIDPIYGNPGGFWENIPKNV